VLCGACIFVVSELRLSHLGAMLLFALLVSVVLACLSHRTRAGGLKYALWSFVLFVLVGVGVAWLMYPISR
jgi:hypothetical protein